MTIQQVIILILLGAAFFLGWDWKGNSDQLAQQAAKLAAQKKAHDADVEWNVKVQTLSKHGIELNRKLEGAVAKPIYTSCNLTPDVVRLLDSYRTTGGSK